MAKVGRPSDYRKTFPGQAEKLCKLGATDKEIADFFEVSESTINVWKAAHPEFVESLKTGKAKADERVERSLYHRALGYSHLDTHISNYQGVVTQTSLTKFYPPDTTACIFWLKNRRSGEWRDRLTHEGGDADKPIHIELNDTELARRVALILSRGDPGKDKEGA